MTRRTWSAVDAYLAERLIGTDAALQGALDASDAAGLPAMQVTPTQGKFLSLMARAIGARSILEIGTLGGYSTIWLARALPRDGRLVSCEVNPRHAAVARANLTRAGLDGVVEVRTGRALETLAELARQGHAPFDLVFIDADKPSTPDYFLAALKLSHPGTLIIADNVVREGRLIDATGADASTDGVRRFIDMLAANAGVFATALQTVGDKGYDGFAVALVLNTSAD
jgi:predicted O-methyltransferase YrrM